MLAANDNAVILPIDRVSFASALEAQRACKLLQSHICQTNTLDWRHFQQHSLKCVAINSLNLRHFNCLFNKR